MPSVRSDTVLPTPTGWVKAGELRVGDHLFDAGGQPVEVTEVAMERPQAALEVKMVMDPMVVSDDHDLVIGLPWATPWIGPVARLHERAARLTDPLAPVERVILELPDLDLPADPWTYGYWRVLHLPEGTLAVPQGLGDLAIEKMNAAGMHVQRQYLDMGMLYLTSPDLEVALDKIGVWSGLAPEYLRAGTEQRRSLLAGLFDARARFSSGVMIELHRPIMEGAADLAMSLGLRASKPIQKLPRLRVSPHDAPMELRAAELERFLTGPKRPGYRADVPYVIRRAAPADPGDFVAIHTATSTYLVGQAMIPVRDW